MGISSFIGQPSLSDDYDSRERARVKLKIPSSIEWQKILIFFYLFGSADLDFGPLWVRFTTCRVIDESEMIRVLVDESFDEINLLQRDLDGIFMLGTAGSIGHPQLQKIRSSKAEKWVYT